jgi:G patch domain-containing protein 1
MDEEDLADAAEAQKIQTSQAFAGLGSSTQDELKAGGLMGLFRAAGDTMGTKLLRRMGWKDGQGIGPKVRRKARLDTHAIEGDTHLFAPDNVSMIRLNRKTDRKGLGHHGETRLSYLRISINDGEDDDDELPIGLKGRLSAPSTSKRMPNSGKT